MSGEEYDHSCCIYVNFSLDIENEFIPSLDININENLEFYEQQGYHLEINYIQESDYDENENNYSMFDGGNVVFNVDTVGDIENIDTLHEKYHLNSYEGFSYNNVEYNVHEAFYYILYPFGKLEKYLNQEFTPTIDSTYNDLDSLVDGLHEIEKFKFDANMEIANSKNIKFYYQNRFNDGKVWEWDITDMVKNNTMPEIIEEEMNQYTYVDNPQKIIKKIYMLKLDMGYEI